MKVRVSRPLCRAFSPIAMAITMCSLLLFITGCGAARSGGGPATPAGAPTVSITPSAASIASGSSSTLTVAAANATQVTLTGSDGSMYALQPNGGTQAVTPTATTTYTAKATGAGGSASAVATVTVTPQVQPAGAPTVSLAASPASIVAGSLSTLTVVATNATQVTVAGSDGTTYDLSAAGGTQAVTPSTTTTYTATAIGAGGQVTAVATVTVASPAAPPTVSIMANPTTITAGSNSTLTVAATNATTVIVSGSDGSSNAIAPAGGTLAVSPAATTTYTVTAANAGGNATATATVTVVPAPPPVAPTVTLSASPTTIASGGSATLTVVSTNATTVVLAGTDGSSFELPMAGGTETVSPKSSSTYTVTATGATGTTEAMASVIVTVTQPATPTATIAANPQSIALGSSSTLTVTASNATSVTISGTDGSSYTLAPSGGTQTVNPTASTTYTVTADGAGAAPATATATVTVVPPGSVNSINHVVFLLQENHSFDNYFGMLNPYRQNPTNNFEIGDDGNKYDVDGIDDKLTNISNKDKQGNVHTLFKLKSTCIDDSSSAWSESYGDVSLGDYKVGRSIRMNGFVSNADGFANSKCPGGIGPCTGYSDVTGDRAMGYYDQGFLNYYYYMASQFALSDRWFSTVSSKSIPNRIATFTGGTTQGLTQDPGGDDHLNQLGIKNIFQELDTAGVAWKVYYTVNNGECDPEDCKKVQSGSALYPATTFSYLTYSYKYLYGNSKAPDPSGCVAPASPSSVIGDTSNTFCIDLNHIAPLRDTTYGYFADLKNATLPSFAFIESGSGVNDEHPGYQQSVLSGQYQVSTIINALMSSTSWKDSVFFLSYDEGGGPYDHVPPVPMHTNDKTTASMLANYPTDISGISVNPGDGYNPCAPQTPDGSATLHCDLKPGQPGTNSGDDAGVNGFGAQLGFRVPNMVVSPFTRKHYVSHVPMDHTAIIRFVEDRFIGNGTYLTARDAVQPKLLDFFDFSGVPWATPPTPPAPVTQSAPPGTGSCTPASMGGNY